MKSIGVFLLILFSSQAFGEVVIANVRFMGTYGDGGLYIILDRTVNAPGCSAERIDVAPNHPESDVWASIARDAYIHGKPVMFQANGCRTFTNNGITQTNPTLDDSTYSWFGFASQ